MKLQFLIKFIFTSFIKEYYLDEIEASKNKIYYKRVKTPIIKSTAAPEIIETTSFKVDINCQSPYGDTLGITCSKFAKSVIHAAKQIEKMVYLPSKIAVTLSYKSFCADGPFNLGKPCQDSSSTLAYAAPTAMYQISKQLAQRFGLDSNYLYPKSLVKQYLPTDKSFENTFDIYSAINSDRNWDFIDTYLEFGPNFIINGGFFNQSNYASYDIVGGTFT